MASNVGVLVVNSSSNLQKDYIATLEAFPQSPLLDNYLLVQMELGVAYLTLSGPPLRPQSNERVGGF